MLYDVTKNGIEHWRCNHCGHTVITDRGQENFVCPKGCPGHWTFQSDVYRDMKPVKPIDPEARDE